MTADETAAQTAGVDVEAVAREAYRFLHPGGVDTPDLLRSPESDAAERDRAYETWDDGRAGTFDHAECRGLAAALAPVIAAAKQEGRDEQAAAVEAVCADWTDAMAGTADDLGQVVGGEVVRSVRAVLSPNTDTEGGDDA